MDSTYLTYNLRTRFKDFFFSSLFLQSDKTDKIFHQRLEFEYKHVKTKPVKINKYRKIFNVSKKKINK